MVDGQNGEDNIMKRFLLVASALFLALASAGCDRYGETNELTETTQVGPYETKANLSWNFPELTSLEEFVEIYKEIREGKAVGDTADKAESVNYLELDKLYVPTVIPEGYHLYEIKVNEHLVSFRYLLESHMVSPDIAYSIYTPYFSIAFWRGIDNMDGTLRQHNATEEDLIDGKYLFVEPNYLYFWEYDGVLFRLDMPLPLLEKQPDEQAKIAEMIKYAEVEVVDLGG